MPRLDRSAGGRRRVAGAIALALLCVILELPARPATAFPGTSSGSQDFAIGAGQYANATPACASPSNPAGDFTASIAVSAYVAADGLSPNTATGVIVDSIYQPGGPCHGSLRITRVNCLVVNGNVAWMQGAVKHATGFFAGHETVGLTVMENPTGPDTLNHSHTFQVCPVSALAPTVPLTHGHFVVKDNP